MSPELQQLVVDVVRLTGAAPPMLMDDTGPTLRRDSLASEGFYLVGLIGGKEVGKSALVNALVGESITKTTSFGPGTEIVVAYAHETQVAELRKLLDREVPGQYRIVSHRLAGLARQVLLDLPDIDSLWVSHVEVTRRMLRHMLFPLWVQSVEKYADAQPQQLLAKVAEGNAANNFVFCLNKADQLEGMNGAVEELRADFASRVGRTLKFDPPKVWMLSAANPQRFDLPALRGLLSQQKSENDVKESQRLAVRQQDFSLVNWLEDRDLAGRLARLERLEIEARELLAARVGDPLLENALPELADDPASRLALTDEVLSARVNRWPIVNLVQTVMTPVLAVVRRNVGATRTASLPDAEALVEAHLNAGGTSLPTRVRSVFAQLQQTHPQIGELYANRKLWEDNVSDMAAAQLRAILTETVAKQREEVRDRLTGKRATLTAPLRWILTIGAVVWFPFAQPILATFLDQSKPWSTHDVVTLTVKIFSVNELLTNLEFLALYFFVLWVVLRWETQRRVTRWASRWRGDSSATGLAGRTIEWMDGLFLPIRKNTDEVRTVCERLSELKNS